MDHQQQTQQTENLIKEMLEFLNSSSEEEEEEKVNETFHEDTVESNNKTNSELLMKALTETKNDQKSIIAKVWKNPYPIWNTKEIVSKKDFTYQQTPTAIAKPKWRQSSLSLLDKSDEPAEADVLTATDKNDWHTKLEANFRRSSNNAYMQEIQKAIYGDTADHPASDSVDYYQAAQNYAVYGKNFLDFPENLQSVLNEKSTCSSDNTNTFANGLYPISQVQGGLNSFGIPNITTLNTVGTTSAAAAASTAAAAAYYQMCNGMQTRQTVGNPQTYGIFLGNKVTYVAAAPTAPSIVYNQHTTSTTNFISNSLANAALATSPAILYSNPVLTTTTQQCLNTFFKETQFLCNASSANPAQGVAVGTNGTGIYERILYAQMLQQQMYHTQQAASVAAMFQHKQRIAAAAAAAAASSRQTTNGVSTNIVSNGNTTVAPAATPISTICNTTAVKLCSGPTAKVCKNVNQSSSVGNTSPNLTVSPTNTTDGVSNELKN